jgi:hypothetical protein
MKVKGLKLFKKPRPPPPPPDTQVQLLEREGKDIFSIFSSDVVLPDLCMQVESVFMVFVSVFWKMEIFELSFGTPKKYFSLSKVLKLFADFKNNQLIN